MGSVGGECVEVTERSCVDSQRCVGKRGEEKRGDVSEVCALLSSNTTVGVVEERDRAEVYTSQLCMLC